MVKRARKIQPIEEVEEVEEVEEEVEEDVPHKRVAPKPQYFTALLMNGATYEYCGMKFRAGIPQPVPIKYKARFKSNGWFQVS